MTKICRFQISLILRRKKTGREERRKERSEERRRGGKNVPRSKYAVLP
jgi:hypothetical protein